MILKVWYFASIWRIFESKTNSLKDTLMLNKSVIRSQPEFKEINNSLKSLLSENVKVGIKVIDITMKNVMTMHSFKNELLEFFKSRFLKTFLQFWKLRIVKEDIYVENLLLSAELMHFFKSVFILRTVL